MVYILVAPPTCTTMQVSDLENPFSKKKKKKKKGAANNALQTDGKETQWKQRLDGLLGRTLTEFFPSQYGGEIMSDQQCEPQLQCDGNSACFKGLLSSSLAVTTTIVPDESNKIMPKLKDSATAAAKQCSGGSDGNACGQRWYQSNWDGTSGLEQQMSALSVLSSSLISGMKEGGPKSSSTGGTSKGDPNAGNGSNNDKPSRPTISTGDRAGAGILTGVFLSGWIGGAAWLVSG